MEAAATTAHRVGNGAANEQAPRNPRGRNISLLGRRQAGGQVTLPVFKESLPDVSAPDRVIVLTAHKLNIKAGVEMRGRGPFQWRRRRAI